MNPFSSIGVALPFYTGVAQTNVAGVRQVVCGMEEITPAMGEALLPTAEAASALHIDEADLFKRDLLALRGGAGSISAKTLGVLSSHFSEEALGEIKKKIVASVRQSDAEIFTHSDPATVQQLGAFFLHHQRRQSIISGLHLGASVFVAGGFLSAVGVRWILKNEIKNYCKALVKAGFNLGFWEKVDVSWVSDFLVVPALTSVVFLDFIFFQGLTGNIVVSKEKCCKILRDVAKFTSLFWVTYECLIEGGSHIISGRSGVTFDPIDVTMYATSGLLMYSLVPLIWYPRKTGNS